MGHTKIRRVSKAEAARLRKQGYEVLSGACELGCYFCKHPHEAPCCLGDVCKAPESQRAKKVAEKVDKLLASGKAKVQFDPKTRQAKLIGVSREMLHGVNEQAVLTMLTRNGTAATRLAITRAQQMAGVRLAIN